MNSRQTFTVAVFGSLILAPVGSWGCIWSEEHKEKLPLGVEAMRSPLTDSVAYKDTIGAYTYYEGLRSMRVRGYGLVAGLGENGSSDCPRNIYEHLVASLYKQENAAGRIVGETQITPETLIRDSDTAVVIVQGDIPPAAVRGTRFDVAVMALPGTQTRSLRGGRLYLTQLRVFKPVSTTVSLTGQVLAQTAGPLFLNPFSEADAPTRSTALEGTVLGGGVVTQDRRLRLILLKASYQRARQIQDRINARFPGPALTASAVSPSFIRLHLPDAYAEDTAHFLGLVRALYVSGDPRRAAMRSRLLAQALKRPDAPRARIALAFEGLGRSALPVLEKLYADQRDPVSFYAAVAGLRLGDHVAGDVLAIHVRDPECPRRFRAIRALAAARGMAGATMALRRLLHDEDPRIRIEAYQALLKRGDSSIRTVAVGGDQFHLDVIPSTRSGMVYVRRSGQRRIALFGERLRLQPPLFYRSPDGGLTLTAREHADHLIAVRVAVAKGISSPPIPVPFALFELIQLMGRDADVDLDGKVLGLGLDYTSVVGALHHLSRDGSLPVPFLMQQPNAAEWLGPQKPGERPESELGEDDKNSAR